MVHLAGRRGLAAAAGPPAVLVAQGDGVADPGGDGLGVADVQRQARPGQAGAELPAPQERRQPARTRQQVHRLADDGALQGLPRPRGVPVRCPLAATLVAAGAVRAGALPRAAGTVLAGTVAAAGAGAGAGAGVVAEPVQ